MPYVKYDWKRIGPRIVREYVTGRVANSVLMDKYGLKPGALWAFLKKAGVIRTHKEARAIARKHGRLTAPAQKPRTCGACTQTFQPINPRHRICGECAPTPSWRKRFDKYGVSKVHWDRLLTKQDGHCALCPRPATHVDHNHKTMAVRGLLCAACNQAMRAIDDNPRWGVHAATYARRDTGLRANARRHATWEKSRKPARRL